MTIKEHLDKILAEVDELKDHHTKGGDELIAVHDIATATFAAQKIFERREDINA